MKNKIALILMSLLLNACGGSDSGSHKAGSTGNASEKRLIQVLADYDNNGENDSTKDYEYDQQGHLLFLRIDSKNDGDYDTVIKYTYDEENNKIKESRWVNKGKTRASEVIKTYDGQGNMLTNTITDDKMGIVVYNTYTYNDDNKIATRIAGSQDTEKKSLYTYVYSDNMLEIRKDRDNNGTIDDIEKIRYDDKGNEVKKATYKPDGTLSSYFPNEEYTYDEQGNKLTRKTISGDILSSNIYTYDNQGNKLTVLYQRSNGKRSLYTYIYE